MRQEERMSWQNSVMFIARIARVRCLVIGAVGEFVTKPNQTKPLTILLTLWPILSISTIPGHLENCNGGIDISYRNLIVFLLSIAYLSNHSQSISIYIFHFIPIAYLLWYNKKDSYFHTNFVVIPISISISSFILVKLDSTTLSMIRVVVWRHDPFWWRSRQNASNRIEIDRELATLLAQTSKNDVISSIG